MLLRISAYKNVQAFIDRPLLLDAEFLKTVGFIGFSDKKLFGPTERRSTFHYFVR